MTLRRGPGFTAPAQLHRAQMELESMLCEYGRERFDEEWRGLCRWVEITRERERERVATD